MSKLSGISDVGDSTIDSISSRATAVRSFLADSSVTLPGVCSTSKPGQHPTVGRVDQKAQVLLADDGAGIDDRGQQLVGVLAIGVRQLGPDLVPLAEQPVAGAAVLGEQRLARTPGRRGRPAGRC